MTRGWKTKCACGLVIILAFLRFCCQLPRWLETAVVAAVIVLYAADILPGWRKGGLAVVVWGGFGLALLSVAAAGLFPLKYDEPWWIYLIGVAAGFLMALVPEIIKTRRERANRNTEDV